jgi:serine/threonine protein kinase, bacterial
VEGTPFGRYRLLDLLGRGGMGEVWRAYDADTDRVVALKLLPAHLSQDKDFQQRFRREAHAAARLNTPHVIPIHHYGEIDGRLYVDMRLIDGRDLQAVLADGPMEPSRAVRIIEHVALALHAAHHVGLVHRDVKPSNILLDDNDYAYLIDFGIARAADETRLTKSGNMIGSFHYIAPERLGSLGSRTEEDARADIYSLACVLYECLTGQPPFAEDTMANLVVAQLYSPPPRPSITQQNVPEQIDQVIATGMAKDPEQRYVTTVELANAARDAITGPIERRTPRSAPDSPTAQPTPRSAPTVVEEISSGDDSQAAVAVDPSDPTLHPSQPGRRRWIIAGVAAVVVVAAAAGIFAIVGHQTSHQTPTSQAVPTSQGGPPAQVVVPLAGLNHPDSAAVDTAGDIYVADGLNDRVLKLAAGATTQTELPFAGLSQPWDVAVDTAGNVYVADHGNNRVLKLAAGATTQSELPFAGVSQPRGLAWIPPATSTSPTPIEC